VYKKRRDQKPNAIKLLKLLLRTMSAGNEFHKQNRMYKTHNDTGDKMYNQYEQTI